MHDTTITIRTEEQLKNQAITLFESLGMSLSTAINIFMKQAVLKQKYPCNIEYDFAKDFSSTYPQSFFDLFGKGNDLGFDEEPEELQFGKKEIAL